METAQDQSKTRKLSVLILGISLFLSVGLNIYLLTRTYDAENTVVKRDAEVDSLSDVKASKVLFDEIAKLGGKPIMWKTGHSFILLLV
jgi:hypothetical protein